MRFLWWAVLGVSGVARAAAPCAATPAAAVKAFEAGVCRCGGARRVPGGRICTRTRRLG